MKEADFHLLTPLGRDIALFRAVQAVHRDVQLILKGVKATMADIDTLMTTLQAISTDGDASLSKVSELEQKLTDLNNSTPAEVDLQPAIDLAASIRSKLEGVQSSTSDATSAASSGDTATSPDTTSTAPGDMSGSAGSDSTSAVADT